MFSRKFVKNNENFSCVFTYLFIYIFDKANKILILTVASKIEIQNFQEFRTDNLYAMI